MLYPTFVNFAVPDPVTVFQPHALNVKVPVEVNDETDVDPVAVRVSSNPDEARHDAEPVKA
jgi:hypothetical protein